MKKGVFFLLVIILNVCALVKAQKSDLYVKSITRDNGLASNRVNCIYEDSKGFIWFGTQDGLNRFAGYDIGTFRHDAKDSLSISDNRITSIIEEKSTGNLWVGTEYGLNYFDIAQNKFTHIKAVKKDTIYALWYDYMQVLWVGGTNGLYRYNKDQTFTKFEHDVSNSNSLIGNRIFALSEDDNHNLLIGTDKGLSVFNLDNETFQSSDQTPDLVHIRSIWYSKTSGLWVGTYYNGLFHSTSDDYTAEMKNYTTENGVLLNNRVQAITEDDKENLYIADRDGGLIYFDTHNEEFSHYTPDNSNPNSLNSKAFRTMIKSSTGIIWIGTYNSGVNYIDQNRKAFVHYRMNFREDGLFNNNIRCMFEDSEGTIWIGTKEGGGLSRFNHYEGTFTHFRFDENHSNGLLDDYIFTINELDKDHLLIGTYTKGLAVFNKNTGRFKHYLHNPSDPTSISSNAIYKIFKDVNGLIWVATFGIAKTTGELNLFDPQTRTFEAVQGVTQVRTICDADKNHLWLGTINQGVLLFNTKSKKVVRQYVHNKADTLGLQGNNITALTTNNEGGLWIGVDGGGLSYLDISSDKITNYTVQDGLPNNRVFGIQLDFNGTLWLSTANGLAKLDPSDGTIRTYDIRDGLQGNEFESYVSLKTSEGYLLFGGRNGFNMFHPDSIKENLAIPKVMLTGFNLFYTQVNIGEKGSPLRKHISLTEELRLNHKQSVITFEFIALNYTSPEKNEYAYKMEGFDKDWIYVGDKREATYTNLPPGEYTFRVKASNNDKVWNEEGTSVRVIIVPPWWKTWWFNTALILFVVGLVYGYYLFRMKQMKDREQELIQKVKEKAGDLQLAYQELKDKQILIENQNKELIESEDYHKQLNEELYTLNQMLTQQKTELEETIHKLKATQNLLIQSEKMASIGVLTSGIAHEINNPLNFIEGGRASIEDYFTDNQLNEKHKGVYKFLDMIKEGVDRATGIVSSLNRFNHNSANKQYRCNIEKIIDNCLVMLQNRIKYKAEVKKDYSTDDYELYGNEGELHQVFLNIIGNAEQSIEVKGEISILTKVVDDNTFLVKISDTGSGINDEDISKITDPFYTTKDPGKGTGLGLSITYSIIKHHKGTLNFHSELGKGTSAIITLPLSKVETKVE